MKKRICAIMSAILMTCVLSGCGGSKDDSYLKDIKVEDYVTLGEYKGIEFDIDRLVVTQQDVDSLVTSIYSSVITEDLGLKDRAVETGDTVNIDYEGKKDGVAFAGGTATGSILTIGSNQFIPGFEDGLIGVMPGETVDLDITFPELYQSAELAGQPVVFTVKVNFIIPEEKDPEIVASLGIQDVVDGASLIAYAENYINDYAENIFQSNKENVVLSTFIDSCVFKNFPKKFIEKYRDIAVTVVNSAATSVGVTAEEYIKEYYDMELENFLDEYALEALKQNAAMQAVANIENLNVTDEELDQKLSEYAVLSGNMTVEEYLGDNSKEDFREDMMFEKVFQFILDSAIEAE